MRDRSKEVFLGSTLKTEPRYCFGTVQGPELRRIVDEVRRNRYSPVPEKCRLSSHGALTEVIFCFLTGSIPPTPVFQSKTDAFESLEEEELQFWKTRVSSASQSADKHNNLVDFTVPPGLAKVDLSGAHEQVGVSDPEYSTMAICDPQLNDWRTSQRSSLTLGSLHSVYAWVYLSEIVSITCDLFFHVPCVIYIGDTIIISDIDIVDIARGALHTFFSLAGLEISPKGLKSSHHNSRALTEFSFLQKAPTS